MTPLVLRRMTALGVAFALGCIPAVSAEEAQQVEERFKDAEVTGTVVAYTKRSLSLEVSRSKGNMLEMLLPVDPAVTQFEEMTGIMDLVRGDQIRVNYRQKYQRNENGEWVLKSAIATKISRYDPVRDRPVLKSKEGGGS